MVRFIPKQFAENSNHSGVFGSFQEQGGNVGDGTLSSDPDTLQGGSAWPLGWSAATNSFLQIPRGEEIEGVERVFSAAIVQQFIDGITFWQPEMPVIQYQTIVQYQTGSDLPKLYVNITGMNTATPPDNDEVNWKIFSLGGSGRNIGDIFYTSRLDTELNGAVECNGAQYNVADFTGPQAVPALLAAGKLPYVSMTEYESIVSANGSCRCFGWDGAAAAVFKVPKLNDVYIMAGTAASAGEFIDESLPNIIGSTGFSLVVPISGTASGAFKKSTVSSVGISSGGNNYGSGVLNLDASDSSAVYQDGAKVRPDSIRYRAMVQIATGATDEALETCTGVLADVAGLKEDKANTDLSNCTKPYVTETYHSGTEWYRVWSDGWIEQGGATAGGGTTTTLLKPFADTTYSIQCTLQLVAVTTYYSPVVYEKRANSFKVNINSGSTTPTNLYSWYACGY